MGLAIILFGATGDLSRRKVLPALTKLIKMKKLPEDTLLLGVATRELSLDEFYKYVNVQEDVKDHLKYISGNFNDTETYNKIKEEIKNKEQVIFYLATPPSYYEKIISSLAQTGIAKNDADNGSQSIIIEKPFGRDLGSAGSLNKTALKYFEENQIYRIDHYLGKETVQNISVFRFSNGIFEPLWTRENIEYVTIMVAEDIGVENRGKYFEEAGGLRDIVQNHLFQILALIAMEPPVTFSADAVRDEKVKVFKSIKNINLSDVVRGQYVGYRKELNVAADSKVETYVALKLYIDNWRWAGIPFYIRTGKKMQQKKTEVIISFRQPPLRMFGKDEDNICGLPNQLVLIFQPERSIALKFGVKKPGIGMDMMPVTMDFNYAKHFQEKNISDYERLILDCYNRDLTLFARNDGVEACWSLIDPITEAWSKDDSSLKFYEPNTWGPKETGELFVNHCHHW